jgi:hypothetical protein
VTGSGSARVTSGTTRLAPAPRAAAAYRWNGTSGSARGHRQQRQLWHEQRLSSSGGSSRALDRLKLRVAGNSGGDGRASGSTRALARRLALSRHSLKIARRGTVHASRAVPRPFGPAPRRPYNPPPWRRRCRTQPLDENTQEFLEQAAASKFDFHTVSVKAAGDEKLKAAINNAVMRQHTARQLRILDLPRPMTSASSPADQAARDRAPRLLPRTTRRQRPQERRPRSLRRRRPRGDADHPRHRRETKTTRCIKSKSMVSEEINLAHALELAGMDVVETDLGEFIVQISHDKPSHLVAPIVHKDRASIAKLFSEYFGTPYNDDPHALTMQARKYLRDKFRSSDFGMTGGISSSPRRATVACVENEGNQRQSVTTPRVLVSLVGIEKVVPRMVDLAVMLKLLARSATGQPFTVYTNIFGGPREPGETRRA